VHGGGVAIHQRTNPDRPLWRAYSRLRAEVQVAVRARYHVDRGLLERRIRLHPFLARMEGGWVRRRRIVPLLVLSWTPDAGRGGPSYRRRRTCHGDPGAMTPAPSQNEKPTRKRYWVVALSLALSFITYLDRAAMGQAAAAISSELHLSS